MVEWHNLIRLHDYTFSVGLHLCILSLVSLWVFLRLVSLGHSNSSQYGSRTRIPSLRCTPESSGECLKLLMPRPDPRPIKSESLGWEPGISIFHGSLGESNVQPRLRTSALESLLSVSPEYLLIVRTGSKIKSIKSESRWTSKKNLNICLYYQMIPIYTEFENLWLVEIRWLTLTSNRRIWNLNSQSENLLGLETTLFWKPS